MDDRELRSWIETTTGRTVRDVERMGYGASRATFIVAMTEGGDLVARVVGHDQRCASDRSRIALTGDRVCRLDRTDRPCQGAPRDGKGRLDRRRRTGDQL